MSMRYKDLPQSAEEDEQTALFQWAELQKGKYPELDLLFHIANEGKRSPGLGARMKKAGLKSGVPDLFFPVARSGCHGMFIELKRRGKYHIAKEQIEWRNALISQGYYATICVGWEEAKDKILGYLNEKN